MKWNFLIAEGGINREGRGGQRRSLKAGLGINGYQSNVN